MTRNIAVIGAGYWGKNLVRNFHQLGVLKTICDQSGAIRQQMAKDYPDTTVTDDFNALLSDSDIRAVVISAPAAQHHTLATQALDAGKHCEEILWSFAPHDISIILSLAGEEPSYVDSVGSNFLHARIADVTMTNLKFPSGIGAHIFVSWLNPFKEQKLVIVGGNGMLVFDDTEPIETKLVLYPHTIDWQNGLPVPNKAESVPIDLKDIWDEPLKAECKAFLSAIATNTAPLTSGEEGLKVLKILERSQHALEQKEKTGTDKIGTESFISEGKKVSVPILSSFEDVFIHPTAIIDEGAEIGKGTKIWHFSHILSGSKIGENCNIGQNVVIGPDVTIGNQCKIQNNVSIYPGVTLEDGVFCGPSMVFTNVYNPRAEIRKMDQARPTLVKRGTTIGANATIVCGVTIGRYAFIGAGAVVNKNIADHSLVVGNPAKQIGWVCECGERLADTLECIICGKEYIKQKDGIRERQ